MAPFPKPACQALQMFRYLLWSSWLFGPLERWAQMVEPNHHLQQPTWSLVAKWPSLMTSVAQRTREGEQDRGQTHHTHPSHTNRNANCSPNVSPGIICKQKCSEQAVSASVPSLFAAPAPCQPHRYHSAMATEANGSTMAPPDRVRVHSPSPHPTSPLHLRHLQEQGVRRWFGAQGGGGMPGGGNIGLWRKSPTPFPLLSLSLRPDGLQSHILKEKQKTKTQRLTCLKSMKANCSVSPWNPGTGPDLANSVGKKRG